MSTVYCSIVGCSRTAHGLVSVATKRPLCEPCFSAECAALSHLENKKSVLLPDSEEVRRGELLAKVLRLKPIRSGPEIGRYQLGEGYHTKTALGLFRVVRSIVLDGE